MNRKSRTDLVLLFVFDALRAGPETPETMRIYFTSLGCPRNLVDTEVMMGQLVRGGHTMVSDPVEADCAVVNTCSFIRAAVEESIGVILEMAQWKSEVEGRKLIVAGCLPERYRQDLCKSLPEVDVFLGTGAFDQIGEAVRGALDDAPVRLPSPERHFRSVEPRVRTGLPHVAYLKVAEGCSSRCTYCIIPRLRGPQRSRPVLHIVSEAEALADAGVKELVLVAQNVTAYGRDSADRGGLPALLKKLAAIRDLTWIRILYGHPGYVTDRLLETIGNHDNICPYFDVPIQHISPAVLNRMGRADTADQIRTLFARIRGKLPDAVLRTTVMVGFPGETEEEFEALLDFIQATRFDHLGAFAYSDEKDLPSHRLKNHLGAQVKQERLDQLMAVQADISRSNNERYVGETLAVLVDSAGQDKDGTTQGRAWFQAPEIDGMVLLNGPAKQGSFVEAKITAAHDYDLTGEIA